MSFSTNFRKIASTMIEEMTTAYNKNIDKGIAEVVAKSTARARDIAPKLTGAYAQSIKIYRSGAQIVFDSTSDYAAEVEQVYTRREDRDAAVSKFSYNANRGGEAYAPLRKIRDEAKAELREVLLESIQVANKKAKDAARKKAEYNRDTTKAGKSAKARKTKVGGKRK